MFIKLEKITLPSLKITPIHGQINCEQMEEIQKLCLPSTLPDQSTKMTPGVRGEKEALATWDLNLYYRCVANPPESLPIWKRCI